MSSSGSVAYPDNEHPQDVPPQNAGRQVPQAVDPRPSSGGLTVLREDSGRSLAAGDPGGARGGWGTRRIIRSRRNPLCT